MAIIKDTAQKEKILDKISKLMRMQTSSNPNEVAVANKLAKELLDKYDLNVSMVKQIEEKTVLVGKETFSIRNSNVPRWLNVLAGVVGNFYECTVLVKKGSLSFIGFELDRIVAVKFFEYLQDDITRESIEYAYRKLPLLVVKGERNSARVKFCEGVVHAIAERLKAMIAERKKLSPEKGLIVIKQNEITNWLAEEYPHMKNGGKVAFEASIHTMKGIAYGRKIPLITTIEEK